MVQDFIHQQYGGAQISQELLQESGVNGHGCRRDYLQHEGFELKGLEGLTLNPKP